MEDVQADWDRFMQEALLQGLSLVSFFVVASTLIVGSGYGLSTLVRWDLGSKGLIGTPDRYFAVHGMFGSHLVVYLDLILDTTMDTEC